MFIIYLLLVIMGLIIANFVITYTLYSAVDRDMREQVDKIRLRAVDSSVRIRNCYEGMQKQLDNLEARCKSVVGKGKKRRAPEVKDEGRDKK